MSMKQSDAVFHFFTLGQENGLGEKELFEFIVAEVSRGFVSGEIDHSDEGIRSDERKARSYARGLVDNRFKRDKRLNGGVQYKPSTTRGPVGDAKLKELNKALKTLEAIPDVDMTYITRTKEAIEARKSEIAAAKAVKAAPLSLEEAMSVLLQNGILAGPSW